MAPDRDLPPSAAVRCWRVDIGALQEPTERSLFQLMDEEERGRALRFVREADRRSFTAAHGGLRLLLAAMLGGRPGEFRFAVGRFGKPALVGGDAVSFNLSHSGGIVLIAFATDISIGADVERIRDLPDRRAIIERHFHRGEALDLVGLPEAEAEPAFFRCWTRKEAVVKALGYGMNLELDRYRVSCSAGASAAVLELQGEVAPNDTWSLVDLDPGRAAQTHVGAIAARIRPLVVRCRTFDPVAALG